MQILFQYEILIILSEEFNDDELKSWSFKRARKLRRFNASDISVISRGRHRFNYDIKEKKKGSYIQLNFTCMPKYAEVFKNGIEADTKVVRCMLFKRR